MNEQEGQTMKLGIYGGTFNPPHLGHLTSARLALDALGLDALQFVPAATPPHKALPAGSPAPEERLAMVELAADGLLMPKRVGVSDMEFTRPGKSYTADTLEQLHGLYPGSQLVRLEKSYRSTWEIIHFAKGIVEQTDFQAVERHGPAPELLKFSTEEEELVEICRRVEAFHQGKYNAFGIVTRTNSQARELHEKLKALGADVALITPESSSFHNGATVLSIQMSKGLEFDQVLIPQADGENYHTDFDKNLLYVACTRAMHQLDISCVGEVSPLLPFGKEK